MDRYHSFRDLDWPLVILTLSICALGILQIFSATHDTDWSDAWWKQVVWVVVGLLIMWLISTLDYHDLLDHTPVLYVLSVVALIVVLLFADRVSGSRRWIPIFGGLGIQVSEFVKLVIVLLIARLLPELRSKQLQGRSLLKLGGLVGIPMLLVMWQPDLGTALCYCSILAIGMFLAGLPRRYWLALCLAGIIFLPVGWSLLKDYQKARLYTFMNPSSDPQGAGYQVIQSRIAIGSGGMWGQGVAQGSQTQLRFLPVPTRISSSLLTEKSTVLLRVVFALGLYFLLLMQIVQNAQKAPDRAGMYLCMGVASLVLFQLLVNVGMVVGRMPTTGLPLPLMSYGGSSTLSVFAMLGLINSVRLQRYVN